MSQAKKRKVPMRKCVVTGESHPKKDLIRIVRTPEGTIEIDPTGKKNGRGAYISLDPELAIQAEKKNVFNRTFEMEIDKEFYQELYRFLDHQKARKELL
ncbi:RNase P modulator RnpM [Facklamia sp. P12937]|uniref:RNase P modulator RnpM n=1 Tax=Facklamia sp. P12937 TaxID=3421949 RepID=UPI003D17FBED